MKNYRYIIFGLVGLSLLNQSCERTLETEPVERITGEYVWDPADSSGVEAERFLAGVYALVPNGFNRVGGDFLDAASDDAISSATSQVGVELIATSGLTPFSHPEGNDAFVRYYKGIRRATVYLNNFDKVPFKGTLPGEERPLKAARLAEARFLRALFYFELVKRYGGVPLLGDKVLELEDDAELPRNSFAECINYIVSECDLAKDDLYSDPINPQHLGRITRGAAMALKARALLYAASPLYNGGNIDIANELTGYTSEDPARWQLAADAAKDVMDLNAFTLDPDFKNLFVRQQSNEVIMLKLANANTSIENTNGPVGFSAAARGEGRVSPTHELAESFGMVNGLPITDPASGYDPENPYVDRDPRLAATILHNGSPWLNTTLQTYDGGANKPGGNQQQTKTSYYLRKFLGPFETTTQYSSQFHSFILFRYAEILLNFAEARNEANGPDADVYQAIIDIRTRAGIEAGADNLYGLTAGMTTEEMREVIRNERRVELAFEEHRFWDIRRWKIAEEVFAGHLHGISIQRTSSGIETTSVIEVLPSRFLSPKMYLYPIPYSEVIKNRNMEQNPEW